MKRNDLVSEERLSKYFAITEEALAKAKKSIDVSSKEREAQAKDFLDMAQRYHDDAQFFEQKGDRVSAFAALNYAYGWLDAGARISLFNVKDSRLFTVDE